MPTDHDARLRRLRADLDTAHRINQVGVTGVVPRPDNYEVKIARARLELAEAEAARAASPEAQALDALEAVKRRRPDPVADGVKVLLAERVAVLDRRIGEARQAVDELDAAERARLRRAQERAEAARPPASPTPPGGWQLPDRRRQFTRTP